VAHEVDRMGGRSIACINARDRNLLGFRRDLLTASAYGVDEFLLVHGDDPVSGVRSGDLSVRGMVAEARRSPFGRPRVGLTTRLRPVPEWKLGADFLFVQVSFSLDALLRWREAIDFAGPVYAGVLVLSSAPMARKLAADVAEIDIPAEWIADVERDRMAAVERACDLTVAIRDSGAFAGVHLVPVARYREVAARLEVALS
jgi:5,10-methylenetetrahydrofolate reductase